MSIFFNQRRSHYMVIDGDDEEEGLVRNEPGPSVEHPPHLYNATAVSYEGRTRQDSEFTKSQRRWDHIEDIDQFFSLVYEYHRGNGFLCIAMKHFFALFQFIFVVSISIFFGQCVDYDVLFNNKNVTTTGEPIYGKRRLDDAIVPSCASQLNGWVVLTLILAFVFWMAHLFRVGYRLLQLFEIQKFYNTVLEIKDNELSNVPWREVVKKICDMQPEVHLIVNQDEISVLDVYQRILRYKNYMISIMDKEVVSLEMHIPFMGKVDYLSSGLRLNLEWLFFRGPWAPWKGPYAIKDEFKNRDNLPELTVQMRKTITYMGFANLCLFPFVFIYQVLFSFFSYADIMRRDPGVFGARKYSNYARLKLRHYNELDHELNYRLNRSYDYAVRYMDQFVSPMGEIVAKAVAFTGGSVFAVLFLLSVWDEDVLNVEHVVTIMTACGAVAFACRSFIPNENIVLCQNFLMKNIVANIHYAPSSWISGGHSSEICAEFSRLFQLKVYFLVEELLSPIITPLILLFRIRDRASDIVYFFHEQTASVEGIGDICQSALMEPKDPNEQISNPNAPPSQHLLYARRRKVSAKVELSLLNFVTQHPSWKLTPGSEKLVEKIKEQWAGEHGTVLNGQQISASMKFGVAEEMILASMLQSQRHKHKDETSTPPPSPTNEQSKPSFYESKLFGDNNRSSLLQSSIMQQPSSKYMPFNEQANDDQLKALEMSMNALAVANLLQNTGDINSALYGQDSTNSFRPPRQSQQQTERHDPFSPLEQPHATQPAQSNIWGVPEESVMSNESDYNQIEEIDEHEYDHEDDNPIV